MSDSPIQLRDKSGRRVFDGTQSPGGGSQPVQAVYGGDSVSIADAGSASLPFTTLAAGTELLDRTDLTAPTFLAAGAYALTLGILGGPLTAGGNAFYRVGMPGFAAQQAVTADTLPDGGVVVTVVAVAAAGDPLGVAVDNNDGAAARFYQLAAAVLVKLG